MPRAACVVAAAALAGGFAQACAPMSVHVATVLPRPRPPPVIRAERRIVTENEAMTEPELASRAERELMEQLWSRAAADYRLLYASDPDGPQAPEYLFDAGLALEGAQERPFARDTFIELARRFAGDPRARSALVRAASLDAYLEDWPALERIGDELLARADLEDIERLVALGARGLARVESGSDNAASSDTAASKDILDGLELGDSLHYGERDVLPVAVAQLRFALGELRRLRSERIRFDPMPDDFLEALDARCALLLEAQSAYAQAVRSVDPHWAAMAGYRVGAMYAALHHDLMQIPPPATSKTERQKEIFFAFMHVRYRVLLEKGLREIEQTIALGARTSDSSPWIERAREAKEVMQARLADEQAVLQEMPFTEVDVKAALDLLQKKTLAAARPPAR